MDEPGEELGIVAVARRLAQQADDRFARPAGIGFEIRIELVRHRQPRIQRDRLAERFLGAASLSGVGVDVLADHPMAAAQMRPCGRKRRIELEALLVQRPRVRQSVVGAREPLALR